MSQTCHKSSVQCQPTIFQTDILDLGEHMLNIKPLLGAAIISAAMSGHADEGNNLDTLASQLISLRGEVEELQAKLDNKKETHKNRMASLAVQRTDLETQLQRNNLELKQISASLEQAKLRYKDDAIAGSELKPLVINVIAQLKQKIASGLPFKTTERIATLSEISDQVELDILPAHKAVNRLWAFVDDEIRMTREAGIFRQPILLNGQEKLADIARVGLVVMVFQSAENEYGYVSKVNNEWRYEIEYDTQGITHIQTLFDSLKKQIRSGYFELPNSLVAAE